MRPVILIAIDLTIVNPMHRKRKNMHCEVRHNRGFVSSKPLPNVFVVHCGSKLRSNSHIAGQSPWYLLLPCIAIVIGTD